MTEVRKRNPTIEYLRRALRADRRIDALIERSARYMDRATRATSRMTATRTSGTSGRSSMEDSVLELVELSDALLAEIDVLTAAVREIEEVIARVPDDRHRDLLRWRYLNGWTWERITAGLGLSDVRWVHRMHGKALLEVGKFLEA